MVQMDRSWTVLLIWQCSTGLYLFCLLKLWYAMVLCSDQPSVNWASVCRLWTPCRSGALLEVWTLGGIPALLSRGSWMSKNYEKPSSLAFAPMLLAFFLAWFLCNCAQTPKTHAERPAICQVAPLQLYWALRHEAKLSSSRKQAKPCQGTLITWSVLCWRWTWSRGERFAKLFHGPQKTCSVHAHPA